MTAKEQKIRDFFECSGHLILLASAIDEQLNRIIIYMLGLDETIFLETVVASLDTSRKTDMIKSFSSTIRNKDWRSGIKKHAEKVEDIARVRNIVAHSVMRFDDGEPYLTSIATAKLFRGIDMEKKTIKRTTRQEIDGAIERGEATLRNGEEVIENLRRFDEARRERIKSQP